MLLNATSGCTVSSGPVPGLSQSAPRAELWALISALKWGLRVRVAVVIWTDLLKGAEGIRCLLEDPAWLPRTNIDLWKQIAELVRCFNHESLDVQHVPSHLERNACESPLEEWLADWNNRVDRLAGQTNLNRDVELAEVHAKAMAYHQRITETMRALRGIYFGIAERTAHRCGTSAVDDSLEDTHVEPQQAIAVIRLHEELPLNWVHTAFTTCPDVPESFVQQVCQFLVDQDMSSPSCFEVSWVELLVMVSVFGGFSFPTQCRVSGAWRERQFLPLAPALTFAVQLRLLRSIWRRSLGAALLEQFAVRSLDRSDCGVLFPLDGLMIGCNRELLLQAGQALKSWAVPPVRTVGQLARTFHF